jgi:hypothetical protein
MPTYTFKCPTCGIVRDEITSISHYTSPAFQPPMCHGPMERFFTAPDPSRALDALTSDAIYDGLKASDGTDISTRAKHRAYMKERNLTTVDDYTETWARAAREREQTMAGHDPERVLDVVEAVRRQGG